MYIYYFLTSFKPELKQSIWWKKHITQMQMVSVCMCLRCLFSLWRAMLIYMYTYSKYMHCTYVKPCLVWAFFLRIFIINFLSYYFPYIFFTQIQFAILIFHFARPIFNPDCNYPKFWLVCATIQNLFMFILFGDFYIKAYLKRTPKSVQTKDKKLSDDEK